MILLLLGCARPARKVELAALFPGARTESIVSASDGAEPAFHQGEQWRFYLHRRLPLRLTLQMEATAPGHVTPILNSRRLARQTMAQGAGVLDVEAPAEGLELGWNVLTLETSPGLVCQAMLVAPLQAALSSRTGEVVRPSVEGSSLLLPFGQTVSFPLPPQGPGQLTMTIEPWLEEGVAPFGNDSWTLTVVTRQDDPATRLEWQFRSPGTQRIALSPFTEAAILEFSLDPNGRHAPLPGQLGLRLISPMLEAEEVVESPGSPPPLTFQQDGVRLRDLKLVARPPALYDLAKDPQAKVSLTQERPATALHLESVWLASKGRGQGSRQDDQALRNLRTLEYLR